MSKPTLVVEVFADACAFLLFVVRVLGGFAVYACVSVRWFSGELELSVGNIEGFFVEQYLESTPLFGIL